jgi:AAHS family 4-hydroxybenzoate transporter-like MFS transporter
VTTPDTIDVAACLDHGEWTGYQKRAVLLAALVIVFDGFDNQLLGFAIPAIVKDWHVARAAFAPSVAAGLTGMGVGAAFGGPLGDRTGRRAALILAVIAFAAGTLGTAFVPGLAWLAVLRLIAGLGLGGAFPNATAFAAEFAQLRRRALAVSLTIVCVPLGGMIAGLIAAQVLPSLGWRALFLVGGVLPSALMVLLVFAMPESPGYLVRMKQLWPELGRMLTRMGKPAAANAAYVDTAERRAHPTTLSEIFGPGRLLDTLCIWVAFLCCLMAVFTVFSWLPAMLAAQGLGLAAASAGLTSYNLGGVAGVLIYSALITRFGSRGPMLLGCVGGAASVCMLRGTVDAAAIRAGFAVHGFFVNAVQVSAFALAAHLYPAQVRSTGVAFAYTFGRIGPLVGAFTGAALIQAGSTAYLNFLAASMVATFLALALLRNHIPGRVVSSEFA